MPSKKQQVQDRYNQILPFIDEAAVQYYGGNRDRGFLHWAFATIFVSDDPQDTDIIDCTAIDGPDDFEIDGRYIPESDDDTVVNLLQCKHRQPGTTMRAADIAPFLNSPNRVLNVQEVVHSHNEEIKYLHDRLRKILQENKTGCTIHLVWATSGTLSQKARRHAEENSSRTITVDVDGNPIEIKTTLKCWDLADLYEQFITQQESEDQDTSCDVEFKLEPDSYHQTVSSDYRTLSMTVPVREIIESFDKHKFKIFRLNPRGPLGNRISASIKRTLLDETSRKRFHLLNNGITAICKSWNIESDLWLSVQDFQIINGCQTTVTLWDTRAAIRDDPSVLVTVKLTECSQDFSEAIASATNTQTALKAEDFISNEPVQKRLQAEFGAMKPPWFYQVKRGEWSKMIGGPYDKEKFRDPEGGFRKLTSKEVAQAVVAFAGFPGEAKDKIRDFLNRQDEDISWNAKESPLTYRRIYTQSLNANQLLLPAIIQRKVWKQVAEDKKQDDWLEYARFHIVWVIGDVLRDHYKVAQLYLFPATRSDAIAMEMDKWFTQIYRVALVAIRNARQDAQTRGEYPGHREFFRTPASYRAIESNRVGALEMAKEFGDPTAGLPA